MYDFPSIDFVMSLTPGGMRDGRDNVLKLLEKLNNPQDTLSVLHVTGSNGKGSVCQMLSQVLWKSFGKKVGLFTSPHFIKINERFQINGVCIDDQSLEKYYERVLKLSGEYSIPLSFFEIQVVVMVLYFYDQKVDYAVVEVGLGGKYDGTNIFSRPLACCITSITLEHTHVLGKTKNTILRNKLGIVKPGTRLYCPLNNALIRETCKKIEATYIHIPSASEQLTNLPGNHQQRNASLALTCLRDIGYDTQAIKKGLKNIYNPGRFEWIAPHILVDTANNTENIRLLARMIQKSKRKKIITIFGTTQVDPIYAAELAQMITGDIKILVDEFCDRSLPCSEYRNNVRYSEMIHFFGEKEKIKKWLQQKDYTIIIYGSFYLVGEIMKLSRYQPFASA